MNLKIVDEKMAKKHLGGHFGTASECKPPRHLLSGGFTVELAWALGKIPDKQKGEVDGKALAAQLNTSLGSQQQQQAARMWVFDIISSENVLLGCFASAKPLKETEIAISHLKSNHHKEQKKRKNGLCVLLTLGKKHSESGWWGRRGIGLIG